MNAEIRQVKTAAESGLAEAFAGAKARLPGGKAVAEQREAAFRRFEKLGLPHRRVEEWKYTDLRALMRDAKPLAAASDAAAAARAQDAGRIVSELGALRIVVADGHVLPGWADHNAGDPGITVTSLAAWLADEKIYRLDRFSPAADDAVMALNTAFMSDGVVIRVKENACIERPIHIAHVVTGTAPAAMFPRSIVMVEPAARLMLIETFEGPAGVDYQVNTALELTVGDRAHVDRVKIGLEGANALHVSSLMASVGAQARFSDFAFTTGGAVTRNQLSVRCAGEGSILRLSGASLLTGRQHVDTTLVVDHAQGHCISREVFKTVLDGASRGVFQGKIIVRPGAQKTDGKMVSNALLLSEDAEADNKPELEIFADDVQCGHGATTGALDDDLKFYLMARGIPEKQAEALLIHAFVGGAVETIEHAGLREILMEATGRWLAARG
jgi:Fe-S cluster assembly protein SufD